MKFEHWEDFRQDFQENGWINAKEIAPDRWGTYRRFETGWMRMGKDACTGKQFTCEEKGEPVNNFGCPTPTALVEFWPLLFENYCVDRANEIEPGRYDLLHEMMPHFDEPASGPGGGQVDLEEYPIILTTGRRIPVYFHSEHRQLPWCRELWPVPRMEINPETAAELGLEQGDWAWIESPWGKVRQTVDLYYGIAPGTINCEHQWWYPELAQADKGFKLSCINCIVDRTAQDKYNGSSTVRGYPVKVYKATPENSPFGNPVPCGNDGTEIIHDSNATRQKLWALGAEGINPDKIDA